MGNYPVEKWIYWERQAKFVETRDSERGLDPSPPVAVHPVSQVGGRKAQDLLSASVTSTLSNLVCGGQTRSLQRPQEPIFEDWFCVWNIIHSVKWINEQ